MIGTWIIAIVGYGLALLAAWFALLGVLESWGLKRLTAGTKADALLVSLVFGPACVAIAAATRYLTGV